ncbi:MAG TPA: phosphate regulon sensor histidine kinase PhoR [Methylotenera sp.]|nr:phosphate regulon sensor histidine kinase PhoR [Methylotenera sp.]HPH05844.1 phosphate regulon sensor histidine kinase PhoR [Methylotenera sp.]HPN00626.1 phosphate regulon sensor histidine kinase PhoR [Methylotenera sp.]
MLDVRWKAFLLFCAFSVICVFLWFIAGEKIALVTFCSGLLVYLARHIYWLYQLQKWFKKPHVNNIPEGAGVWEDVFTALLKYERNNQKNQTQLSESLERFSLATTAMPDGLVILSASNEIEWCTPHAENQLGLNLAQDKHLPIVNLIRDSHFIAYLYNGDFDTPFKLKSWRNPELTLEILLIPFANNQKLLISRDTTQLEKVETMRRDFIANVSHELRTPLTVVGGFLETLSDMEGAIPAQIKHYFAMMEEQTVRMRRIIEDLLTLSTIESNAETPENIEINMPSLLQSMQNDALSLSQSLYKSKHDVHLDADPQLYINGAQEELRSALSNLVSNAVRYTPKGGELWLSWQRIDGNAVFAVRDTGIGIASEHIDRLTERFYRVDRGRSRETGGTGLGLSIVKHILIRHQAKLEITSALGAGSTFRVIFPKSRVVTHSL